MFMTKIDSFINTIATSENEEVGTSANLYKGNSLESQVRKWNLNLYLERMKTINPKVLFLGEAPGYKGCKLTGIPFTSEKLVATNAFFNDENYRFINSLNKLESEISATMVWNELNMYERKPLMWNIFPFHPYQESNHNSNRTPNNAELNLGQTILEELLQIFSIERIVAVGRKAESRLTKSGIEFEYVRHPANGGKNEFIAGINRIIKLHRNTHIRLVPY